MPIFISGILGSLLLLIGGVWMIVNGVNNDEVEPAKPDSGQRVSEPTDIFKFWGEPLRPMIKDLYSITEGEPSAMLEDVRRYAKENPTQFRTILSCYHQVGAKSIGTDIEDTAKQEAAIVSQKQNQVFLEELDKFSNLTHQTLQMHMPNKAYKVWLTFPDQLRSDDNDRIIRNEILNFRPFHDIPASGLGGNSNGEARFEPRPGGPGKRGPGKGPRGRGNFQQRGPGGPGAARSGAIERPDQ